MLDFTDIEKAKAKRIVIKICKFDCCMKKGRNYLMYQADEKRYETMKPNIPGLASQ